MTLPPPACYFPIERDRYDVSPGLRTFGTDFGNGSQDRQIFQLDEEFPRYRSEKLTARAERLTKYHAEHACPANVTEAVTRFIAQRLLHEHPALFTRDEAPLGFVLNCIPTGERLEFGPRMELVRAERAPSPSYVGPLDALASQLQEDLAIATVQDGEDTLRAVHLCFPNHWSPEEKLGNNFRSVHAPVAGIAPVSAKAPQLMDAVVNKGPYVRFAWGVSTDSRLNHHPVPPPGTPRESWHGRSFNPAEPRLFLRVERQVLWGFPEVQAVLFTIRTSFVDLAEVKQDVARRRSLIAALHSMTSEQRMYKGLSESFEPITQWLGQA